MAKKKETILDFDNDPEVTDEQEANNNNSDVDKKDNSASNSDIANDINNASNSNSDNDSDNNIGDDSILASVLSNVPKESKKIYDGFYLEEPVVKTIRKLVKNNKDTNKSKLVNDILKEAFKQAGLL
ncbi:hypothetical protein FKQ51_17590 [Bacillus toyonensis]|uniref:hypothetical protein n=1 Tax=Bacillus toyonensis TaxID=155322 RepID=UPI0026FB79CE|nr:hypothetical protein [Bacillus toyonensis]MDO8159138.1 hypothetical protein [Bacillus toyonensis]